MTDHELYLEAKERNFAIGLIRRLLASPLMMMVKPEREMAMTLAERHNITAVDLLRTALKDAQST